MSAQERDRVSGRSFGQVADAYDRGRPGYPDATVSWLTGAPADGSAALRVLELGAGTGKLTERLVAHGHVVHATDPDAAMLAVLQRRLPDVRVSQTTAEEIPAADGAYDVVVAAQCFHWFDAERALPEIARVLAPGGHFATAWHVRDERIPWVRKLGRIVGTQDHQRDPSAALAASGLFEETVAETLGHWQVVDRRSIVDLMLSRSHVVLLGEAERDRRTADLLALYDDYGRGMDGMQLPYRTLCFRAAVLPRTSPEPDPHIEAAGTPDDVVPLSDHPSLPGVTDSATTIPRVVVELPDDDAVVLIDFR